MKVAALCALAPMATAFVVQHAAPGRTQQLHAEMSKAIPFLKRPEKLDGTMVGDVGFDPLGISDTVPDLQYVRWAELKNGRVAMLATVGFMVQEYIHVPGAAYANSKPLEAPFTVPFAANIQILLGCAVVEFATFDKTYGDGEPGDLGWDPACLTIGKSDAWMTDMKEKELANARLAMVAFVGMVTQTLIFDKPLFAMIG